MYGTSKTFSLPIAFISFSKCWYYRQNDGNMWFFIVNREHFLLYNYVFVCKCFPLFLPFPHHLFLSRSFYFFHAQRQHFLNKNKWSFSTIRIKIWMSLRMFFVRIRTYVFLFLFTSVILISFCLDLHACVEKVFLFHCFYIHRQQQRQISML